MKRWWTLHGVTSQKMSPLWVPQIWQFCKHFKPLSLTGCLSSVRNVLVLFCFIWCWYFKIANHHHNRFQFKSFYWARWLKHWHFQVVLGRNLVLIFARAPAVLRFLWFSSVPPGRRQDGTSIRPWWLPSLSFPNYYLLIILSCSAV
jgi:hypothetical protein